MKLGLGIDTGGTFTDSVIVDLDTGKVLDRCKSLTTRDDLLKGIVSSIKGLSSLKDISLVSLSTTLATNSVVEGRGCRVGSILIGKRPNNSVHGDMECLIDGEFDLRGNIVRELDLEAAKECLGRMEGKVDSLAISGYLSVRYPEHENRIRELAEEMLALPTVCAHDLSSQLGFAERVNTAVINAGLIPVIVELIDAVKRALSESGIDAPLMIVKGDGSIMNCGTAVKRPVETIMSGPAASLNNAMRIPGTEDAVVVDIGGTTTDVGVIRKGFIHTLDSGAVIGGHRTRVRAADVSTYGIGGDSSIVCDGKDIELLPVRNVPICSASNDSALHDGLATSIRNGKINCSLHGVPVGLTPTDVLASEDMIEGFDGRMSEDYIRKISETIHLDETSLRDNIKERVIRKISESVIDHLKRIDVENDGFYEHVVLSSDGPSSYRTMIGIGAPAKAWLTPVAEKLGMDLILPDNFDVSNAVGAISSSVTEYVEIVIRSSPNDMSEDPECRVYAGEESRIFKCRSDALEFADSEGRRLATEKAESSGASEIIIDFKIDEHYLPIDCKGRKSFRGANIVYRASGIVRMDSIIS